MAQSCVLERPQRPNTTCVCAGEPKDHDSPLGSCADASPASCDRRSSRAPVVSVQDGKDSSFDEFVAVVLFQLQCQLRAQHASFVCRREKQLREELELLRGRALPGDAAQVDADPNSTHNDIWTVPTEESGLLRLAPGAEKSGGNQVHQAHSSDWSVLPSAACVADTEFFHRKLIPASTPQIQNGSQPGFADHSRASGSQVDITVRTPRTTFHEYADGSPVGPVHSIESGRRYVEWHISDENGQRRLSTSSGRRLSARSGGPRSTRTNAKIRQLNFIQNIPDHVKGSVSRARAGSNRIRDWFDKFFAVDRVIHGFMSVVVLSNVVTLGFQAGSDWMGWLFVDAVYFFIFFLELGIRVCRGGTSIFCIHSSEWRWNWFDAFLLFLTGAELVWSLDSMMKEQTQVQNDFSRYTQLRVLRILRILRILRLSQISFFKDLGLMVAGTIGGLRTLMWSMVIILVPVYCVALFFTETIGQGAPDRVATELFSTLNMSMFTTFRCLVIADCSDLDGTPIFYHVVKDFGWPYIIVYCVSFLFITFGLFNVIVAIYVESTMAAAKANEALQRQRRLEDNVRLSCKLYEFVLYVYEEFQLGPQDGGEDLARALAAEMTQAKFNDVIKNPVVRSLLHECDVPEEDFSALFDICDADGGGLLSLDEIIGGVRRLRGNPRRSDVVWVMLRMQEVQNEIHALHEKMDALAIVLSK